MDGGGGGGRWWQVRFQAVRRQNVPEGLRSPSVSSFTVTRCALTREVKKAFQTTMSKSNRSCLVSIFE